MSKFNADGTYEGFEYSVGKTCQIDIKIPKNTPVDMSDCVTRLHKLDRTDYDTPASVKKCACQSCNESRKRCGIKTIGWAPYLIERYGILPNGKTVDQMKDEVYDKVTK